jgi:putative heme-binding domain-containing protein
MRGQASRGATAFEKATCITCHQVRGKGTAFGPDLSEIGDKLPVEGLYEAILYPSNAISHGFAAVSIATRSGDVLAGFITSETDEKITLAMIGGLSRDIAPNNIKTRTELDQSLMPPGLAALLQPRELADLVAYLRSLKK